MSMGVRRAVRYGRGGLAIVLAAVVCGPVAAGPSAPWRLGAHDVARLCAYFEALAMHDKARADRSASARAAADCRWMEDARADETPPEIIAASDVYLEILTTVRSEIVAETQAANRGAARPSRTFDIGRTYGIGPDAVEAIMRYSRASYGRRLWVNTVDALPR